MKQVKVFQNDNAERVEAQVNAWIKEHANQVKVIAVMAADIRIIVLYDTQPKAQ